MFICFEKRPIECNQRFNEINSLSDKIIYLNFFEYLKNNFQNHKEIYALGQDRAHFSPTGYNQLVNFIYNKIQSF